MEPSTQIDHSPSKPFRKPEPPLPLINSFGKEDIMAAIDLRRRVGKWLISTGFLWFATFVMERTSYALLTKEAWATIYLLVSAVFFSFVVAFVGAISTQVRMLSRLHDNDEF